MTVVVSALTPLNEKAGQLRALKTEKSTLEDKLSEINKQIAYISEVELPKLMEENGIKSFKSEAGTVFLRSEVYANVLADDRPRLFAWLREQGADSLITEQVHPKTLNSYAQEMADAGSEIPDFVNITAKTKATLRKS